ncbi:MAG: hypothetical protein V4437_00505 [Patescibacteria group bacterium]
MNQEGLEVEWGVPGHPQMPKIQARIVDRVTRRKGYRVFPVLPADTVPGHFDPDSRAKKV